MPDVSHGVGGNADHQSTSWNKRLRIFYRPHKRDAAAGLNRRQLNKIIRVYFLLNSCLHPPTTSMTVLCQHHDNRQEDRRGETIPVLTTASRMLTLFWLDVLCSLVDLHRRLRGAYCLKVLITEAVSASETSVKVYKATRCNMPEDSQLQDWTVVSAACSLRHITCHDVSVATKGIVVSEVNATMWCKVIVATTWLTGTGYFVAYCSRDIVANNELQCQCRNVMKDGTDKTLPGPC